MRSFLKENVLYIALIQALISTLGSLYFSEIRHFPPCVLCWYQRILMYPLVVIIFAGIIQKNKKLHWYVLPFSIIGIILAIYHNLLYYKIIPEAIAPCVNGVSCTTKFIEYLGFITIPLLSLISFIVVTICMLIFMNLQRNKD